MAASASMKLQELKEKMEQQGQELESAFEAGPSTQHEVSMKGVGTFRIEDPESVRLIARRQRAQREGTTGRAQDWKLVAVVLTAASLAIFLLWLLFSGERPQKMTETLGFPHPPMNASQLQQSRPGNVCPEPEWLPEECVGSSRQKSKKIFDQCQLWFEETGYTMQLLKSCGILSP